MRLAGYFGGVWLRTEFVNAGVPRGAFPGAEDSFAAVIARISAALAAWYGRLLTNYAPIETSKTCRTAGIKL
jgi:hypothetical protein